MGGGLPPAGRDVGHAAVSVVRQQHHLTEHGQPVAGHGAALGCAEHRVHLALRVGRLARLALRLQDAVDHLDQKRQQQLAHLQHRQVG